MFDPEFFDSQFFDIRDAPSFAPTFVRKKRKEQGPPVPTPPIPIKVMQKIEKWLES